MENMEHAVINDKLDKILELYHKLDKKVARLEERQGSQAKFWGLLGGFIPASIAAIILVLRGK